MLFRSESNSFGNSCESNTFGDRCSSLTFGKECNNLMLPDNSTYGTLNILGSITGGFIVTGNESNIIEIRQVKKSGAESKWKYIAQDIDDHGGLQTKTKTGTSGTWA